MKKKLLTSLLTSTIIASSLINLTPVHADEYDTKIEEAKSEVVAHDQAAESLNALMKELTNEVTNTQAALDNLKANIQKNEENLEQTLLELEKSNQEMEELKAEIAVLEENIEKRSVQLEEQARTVQVSGSALDYIEFIMNAESLTDIMGRIDIVANVIGTSNKMIEDQINDKQVVVEKTEETEQKIVQQNELAGELEKTSAELEGQKISQEVLVAQLQIEQSTAASEREQLIAQRNEALQRVDAIQNEKEQVRLAVARAEEERQNANNQAEKAKEEENVVRPASASRASAPAPAENNSVQASAPATSSNSQSTNQSTSSAAATTPTQTPARAPEPAAEPVKPEQTESKPTTIPKAEPKPAPTGNVVSIASQYLGTPYLYGGTTPSAFDCSGYTSHVFAQAGKSIPRTASSQYASAQKVSNPQPGDLVFFSQFGGIDHVGIYVGGGSFIGAQSQSRNGAGVAYASLSSGYWSNYVVGYGRY